MKGIKQKTVGVYRSVAVKAGEMVVRVRKEEDGQGLVEYGLIIALVAIALVVGLTALAGGIGKVFTTITGSL